MVYKKYVCPACRGKTGVDILYGMPSVESFEDSKKGLIALGGCVFGEDQPDRKCLQCETEWKIKRRNAYPFIAGLDLPPV